MEQDFTRLIEKLEELEHGICALKLNASDALRDFDRVLEILVEKRIIPAPEDLHEGDK